MSVAIPALLLAFVNSVLQLVVAFGVTISDGQNAAITAVVNASMALGVALYHLYRAERRVPPSAPAPAPPAP